jgi:archaellum component FlaC
VNGEKIGNLEDKVGGVYQKFKELNGTVDNLSRECLSLKQRMVEEIPKITEKARNKLMEHCTSNYHKKS